MGEASDSGSSGDFGLDDLAPDEFDDTSFSDPIADMQSGMPFSDPVGGIQDTISNRGDWGGTPVEMSQKSSNPAMVRAAQDVISAPSWSFTGPYTDYQNLVANKQNVMPGSQLTLGGPSVFSLGGPIASSPMPSFDDRGDDDEWWRKINRGYGGA